MHCRIDSTKLCRYNYKSLNLTEKIKTTSEQILQCNLQDQQVHIFVPYMNHSCILVFMYVPTY
jgi:hypothetical protein